MRIYYLHQLCIASSTDYNVTTFVNIDEGDILLPIKTMSTHLMPNCHTKALSILSRNNCSFKDK